MVWRQARSKKGKVDCTLTPLATKEGKPVSAIIPPKPSHTRPTEVSQLPYVPKPYDPCHHENDGILQSSLPPRGLVIRPY